MTNNKTSLELLKSFLNQLFQFETQDLDFGVYKILHYKRNEIKQFIDNLLVDKVKEQLQTLSIDEATEVEEQIEELKNDDIIKGWLKATEEEKKILRKYGKEKIAKYKNLKTKTAKFQAAEESENQIFNHLVLFFSRYYDKGDFISKRRFGKNEKYVVPYNGEETHFHWANQDQYYIKSSETFQQYAFKAGIHKENLNVYFKLIDAQIEQGNVKTDETNYFILSEKEPEINELEATFFFEYRPLTENEKKEIKGNGKQDFLNENAFEKLKNMFGEKPLLIELWKETDEKPLLLKKLQHYTKKNKYDFFIHKNLKPFLQRELDYYIKSELINVDDLYVTDAESHFERLKHNLKTIKVFKSLAETIIDFVSQIENFQKKLWEKKKFVIDSQWVITSDKLIEFVGEENAKPILEVVVKNEKQIAEWKELFGKENVPKNITIDSLKADLQTWLKFPVDTIYFDKIFKENLLNLLSNKIDLEEKADGLVIKSDNYHGLQLIKETFANQITATYLDPPYNTGEDDFIYKDSFISSSWLTMFLPLLELNQDFLKEEGSLFISCDEHEESNLGRILKNIFGKNNKVEKITWNKRIPKNDKGIGNIHEYIYLYSKNESFRKTNELSYIMCKDAIEEIYELVKKLKARKKSIQEAQQTLKKYYKKQEYDRGITLYCELDPTFEIWGKINMSWPNAKTVGPRYEIINPVTKKPCPVPKKGWRWKEATFRSAENDGPEFKLPDGSMMKGRIWYANNENTQPSSIKYLKEVECFLLRSIISLKSDGSLSLEKLKLKDHVHHPKPIKLIEDLLYSTNLNSGYYLDYFSGSGTTFHAIQKLNNQDANHRKGIMIEQANYVYTVIIPRIKKIAYSFDWNHGLPVPPINNGSGIFFKYQRLEQYEESLENIAFTAPEDAAQKALEFDQYIPKYFLEFETRGSKTLLNTGVMRDPWDYKLKVWDGFTYDTEKAVDLIETFNYLIGLHIQKYITKEFNGKKYQFIFGNNNAGKQILVIWRSVKDWELKDYKTDSEILKKEVSNYNYDILYLNDQAHLDEYQPIEEVFKNKMIS